MNVLQRKPKRMLKKSTSVVALSVLTGVSLILAGALIGQMVLVGAGAALILFTVGISISRRSESPVTYV